MDIKKSIKDNIRHLTSLRKNPEIDSALIAFATKHNLTVDGGALAWHYVHDVASIPSCTTCGGPATFVAFGKGYSKYCSAVCYGKNPDSKKKRQETVIGRFGPDGLKSESVRKKKIETSLQKYGTDNPAKASTVKTNAQATCQTKYGGNSSMSSPEVIAKSNATCLKNHGVLYPMQDIKIRTKSTEACVSKYGKSNVSQVAEIKDKKYYKFISNCIKKYDPTDIDTTSSPWVLTFECDKGHTYNIDRKILQQRLKYGTEPCTVCVPIGEPSAGETELRNFIEEFCLTSKKRILDGKEIDVYIESKMIGFEYNGIWWHSDDERNPSKKESMYHLDKLETAERLNIKLIQIWGDEWRYKKDIVKSRIKNILGVTSNRLYARKCQLKYVDINLSNDFLNTNHLQGEIKSPIRIGLFHDSELVSLMTFGQLRRALGKKCEPNKFEMTRFCNKLDYNVVGGASRLLKFFLDNNPNCVSIMSMADRCWSSGELYKKLGFSFSHNTVPNYWYVVDSRRMHRFQFRKDALISDGYIGNTEREIMELRKIPRIYDCGSAVYEFTCQK